MRKKLKVIDLCSIMYIIYQSIISGSHDLTHTYLPTHDRTLLFLLSLAPVEKNREIHAKSRQEISQWKLKKLNKKHALFWSMPVLYFQLFRTVHRLLDKKLNLFDRQHVKNNRLWLAYTNRKWNKICDWVGHVKNKEIIGLNSLSVSNT